MDTIATVDVISFGPFSLYPGRRRLERDGAPVKLGGRSLDILLALVERAGSVVSKSDLLARVWQDVTVDESALRVHMASLRKTLGDGHDGARYLANVSGRGYAFVADIAAAEAGGASAVSAVGETESTTEKAVTNLTNLPRKLAPIISRDAELAALQDLTDHHRLVTLAGMGGIGKTRLAIELGRRLTPRFGGGVWLVDLAPLTDPALVPGAAAAVLGVSLTNPDKAVEIIAAALTKPTLLIFDNCEHLAGVVAALIDALLPVATGLSVIATSQVPLRAAPEYVFAVTPLALPPSGAAEAQAFGAVELFVARGQAAMRGFQLNGANAAGVIEICRRLEGIPLALEMAAARLPMFGVEGLRAHLNEPMRLLKFREHTPDVRHRTLRDMVEWSHALLDETERRVFRRLASFSGSFSLEAAVAVAGFDTADSWDVSEALSGLIEKSLVMPEAAEPPRYRLLETLRLFALERLEESEEAEGNATRHANFFAELVEYSYRAINELPRETWKARFVPEIDNIRSALDWGLADPSRRALAIAMAAPAAQLFQYSNDYQARCYSEAAIELISEDTAPDQAARLLDISSYLWLTSDRSLSLARCRRAADLYRKIGDERLGNVSAQIGDILARFGQFAEAREALLEARDMLSQSNRPKSLCYVYARLGATARLLGDLTEAKGYYETAISIAREIVEYTFENGILGALAELEFQSGNADRAVELCSQALNNLRGDIDWAEFIRGQQVNITSYLLAQEKVKEARSVATDLFPILRDRGGFALRVALMQWGLIAALENRFTEGALLLGYVDAAFCRTGEIKEPTERHIHGQLSASIQTFLSVGQREALAAESAVWTEDEAAGFTISRLISYGSPEAE